ncbi:GntR family transcriptional regulator [Actinospica sp. MGRD01-02]|uniref:GntR family transcriptional regulator n=1 Tax=Actinospica acidithermotolerans TaxID=2828514 RepID=A0A941ENX1_9ACTN|nr:GntR family transcriptional regulator [Actinospica acidithermotolerans]MBR7831049.1 GntR family transcriptional regulator [Actinospica acidithermotolerans]
MRSPVKRTQARDAILAMVADHEPGEALPSEHELCEHLGVSRPTLRAAVEELVDEGVLVRRTGRGTFKAAGRVSQPMAPSAGVRNGFRVPLAEGVWESRTLSFERRSAGARLARALTVSPNEPVVRAERLRIVDGAPLAVERIHVPEKYVPGIDGEDFQRGSFYRLLRERYGITMARAAQSIEATVTDEQESSVLEVPPYTPALLFDVTTRDTQDRVIEYTRAVYRGDRYRLDSDLVFDHVQP